MQMQIDKKWLIALVNEVKNEINPEEAIQDEENKNDKNKNGVGTNQFRSLASLCAVAETYDEIKLLIQYKIAKVINDRDKKTKVEKLKSWKIEKNGKRFGDVIIEKLEKIKKEYKEDTVVLEAIRLFFGYLYQSARVWRNEILPSTNNGGENQKKNYNKNNTRKNYKNNYR